MNTMKILMAMLFAAVMFAGCAEKEDSGMEEAGDTMEETMEGAGDSMEDAMEEAGDSMDDAMDEASDAMDEAGDAMDAGLQGIRQVAARQYERRR